MLVGLGIDLPVNAVAFEVLAPALASGYPG